MSGSNLAGPTGVTFNGVAASNVTPVSATQLKATVPPGATTGKIAVATIAGTAQSSGSFTVPLAITSFSPNFGVVGSNVVIQGAGFSKVTGVKFGNLAAGGSIDSDSQITAVVPPGAHTGRITVSNGLNSVTSTSDFTVTLPVMVDLGSLGASACSYSSYGGTDTFATAINDDGVVTGGSCRVVQNGGGAYTNLHPFRWADGVMTDLDPGTTVESLGYGISSGATIVGVVGGDPMTIPGSAFLYSSGTLTSLGGVLGNVSPAYAVNDSGLVVGSRVTQSGQTAYAYAPGTGTVTTLPGLGGTSLGSAQAVNNNGVAAGFERTASGQVHAARWTGGIAADLGTLGGTFSYAYGINSAGDVAGLSGIAGDTSQHAFRYQNGAMSDLGTLGGVWSAAYGINDSGDVVGGSATAGGPEHAFLYANGSLEDLNDRLAGGSGWVLVEARGINASGQIVGIGRLNGGFLRGFLLNPPSLTQP
jgi:probable HAF family extracellular repeat protein